MEPEKLFSPNLSSADYGTTPEGENVRIHTLTNTAGIEVRIITYGGIIVSLRTPDRDGNFDDIVLGFDSLEGYLSKHPFFGTLVGRYANRISKGRFTLDGVEYKLARNNGENHLHGGIKGFDKVVWRDRPLEVDDGVGIVLEYTSVDGEEGYPGTLDVQVTYTLNEDNELICDYRATTDRATPINLTQHSYFNLAGQGTGNVLRQLLELNAAAFTPIDAELIPTGEIRPVEGTPFDFRTETPIGARINSPEEQIQLGGGYDHNFILNQTGKGPSLAARVREPMSGRVMEVYTTEPGVQLYTGNFLDGTLTGKGGRVYQHRFGFCLETQHFPDSPNRPEFPSTILRPDETFQSRTVFKFPDVRGT
jgi:aldose 1-epimerase